MKLKTKVKAGSLTANHDQNGGVKLKTSLKAGALTSNHNQNAFSTGSGTTRTGGPRP